MMSLTAEVTSDDNECHRLRAMARMLPQEFEAEVPIDSLEYHPRNPNQGDLGQIGRSIEVNGWWGTVLVQKSTRYILAGNHRVEALRHQGAENVPVVWVDVDDEMAQRIVLADNRTGRLGSDNEAMLAELLTALAPTELSLDGLGYDGDDLDRMLKDLNPPEPEPPEEKRGWRVTVDVVTEEQADAVIGMLEGSGFSANKATR